MTHVAPNSDSAKLGFKEGDVVLKVNQKTVTNEKEIQLIIDKLIEDNQIYRTKKVGVPVDVLSGQQLKRINIPLYIPSQGNNVNSRPNEVLRTAPSASIVSHSEAVNNDLQTVAPAGGVIESLARRYHKAIEARDENSLELALASTVNYYDSGNVSRSKVIADINDFMRSRQAHFEISDFQAISSSSGTYVLRYNLTEGTQQRNGMLQMEIGMLSEYGRNCISLIKSKPISADSKLPPSREERVTPKKADGKPQEIAQFRSLEYNPRVKYEKCSAEQLNEAMTLINSEKACKSGDAEMAAVYVRVRSKLRQDSKKVDELKADQLNWLYFRRSALASAPDSLRSGIFVQLTKERISDLQKNW